MANDSTNRMLGYPDDARLLIINADDFGMCHSVNQGILLSMQQGVVQSTSLMVSCPWGLHAMKLLKDNPEIEFGVHLNLVCDQAHYKWRPVVSREKVPSLADESGFCYPIARMEEMIGQANLAEVEMEFRAQIAMVLASGLKPNHLDWHCLHNGGRADIFEMTLSLAKEYGLALRVAGAPAESVQNRGLPACDYELLDSYNLPVVNKSATYVQMLRDLRPGLSEWAVHPAIDSAEMQAVENGKVRQTDFEFVMSAEARETVHQEGIVLVNYNTVQQAWQGK